MDVPYNPKGVTTKDAICAYFGSIPLTLPPDAARFKIGHFKTLGTITQQHDQAAS